VTASDQTRIDIAQISVPPPRSTQLSSDPPTALVRRESFRELPPGSVIDEIYEVDARLGAGAMGEVYAAHHMKLGKRVAIKVIGQRLSQDDAAIERFAMEAKTLAQIQHPAIVAVEHVGELADGRAYFVMEFLRGESLFERLQRGRVPLPEALRILDQMARGLDAAHGEGVIHRDLKPENTFLVQLPDEPPVIKLVDFGLSKLTADRAHDDQRAERTQSGAAIGTPMYMSPEQMRGPDVDHRTDIYALGCVAYELVLGRAPFEHAQTAPELYAAHLHEAPPLPRAIWPEIPPQLDLVMFAMLAKDPAHRPTLAQVRAVIAAARNDGRSSQRAETEFVGHRAPRAWKRGWTIAIIATIALIGGITIGTRLSAPSEPEKPIEKPAPPVAVPPPTPAPTAPIERVAPVVDASVDAPKSTPPSPPLNTGSAERQSPKIVTPAVPAAPIDAGVDARVEDAPPPPPVPEKTLPVPKPRVDPNKIVDPFAKKRPKVNP
jgi:serine/threonine-protein kinase